VTVVYPFVAIDVPASLAEVAAEQLFELGAEGVEQRDTTTLVRGAQSEGAAHDPGADVATSNPPDASSDEVVTLVAAFATREAALEAIEAFDPELSPRLEEVVGDAWRDAWKEHFEPFRLSARIVVRPPWRETPPDLQAAHVLELEPGRAFGTGLHASTALVSQLLDRREDALKGADVLDVGCGSGILSLVALSLGARKVRAIDIDADAVRVTMENAERNRLADRIVADTTDMAAIEERYPIVVANIQAEVLVPRANDLMARVADGGLLILSGILVEQRELVRHAYDAFALEEAPESGEWVALALRR